MTTTASGCSAAPRRPPASTPIAPRGISDYDFRHSAATHLGRSSNNLPGVMYLLGHKQPATTARYMRPQRDAALEVLLAASATQIAKLSTDSGPIVATDSGTPPATGPSVPTTS